MGELLPFECNAFYFDNHLLRTFGSGGGDSDGYTLALMDIFDNEKFNHGKGNDEWVMTVGFTHPRPHHEPAVILWKNQSIEVRIKSEYDYVNGSADKGKEGHMYKQELLEVSLVFMSRGGRRDKMLSVPLRQKFSEDYVIR